MAAASRVQHQAAALLLLSIALTAQANTARPDPTSGPLRVDKPFNLTMKSYNFNTTLYWDYIQTSVTPYFRVEINDYKISKWVVVKSCRNISRNYCDLSANIIEPYIYYNVRVKAFVGSNSSEYTKMEFCLITDGIIGPPTLNASVGEKMIVVDILHPYVPFIDEKKTVADYFEDLKYIIHYGNDTELTDDCDELGCTAKILTTNLNIYCISAQGVLDNDPMTMEQSKEICIEIVAAKGDFCTCAHPAARIREDLNCGGASFSGHRWWWCGPDNGGVSGQFAGWATVAVSHAAAATQNMAAWRLRGYLKDARQLSARILVGKGGLGEDLACGGGLSLYLVAPGMLVDGVVVL
ncbi:interferon gamma receptor 1 isoform X2 [Pseudophryne corroboree]|uniref:interferon gamma receptor 1 isoform X2 n=1 Tax=Pseudophryne corroboree TaxID=495146 RepID=UPI003081BA2A